MYTDRLARTNKKIVDTHFLEKIWKMAKLKGITKIIIHKATEH